MASPLQTEILQLAKQDDRIRAVILNGSRANSMVTPDQYQDYDIIYMVTDIESIKKEGIVYKTFGQPALQQLPDDMHLGNEEGIPSISYAYLMIYEDGSRLDLTLFPVDQLKQYKKDSLSIVWLDKDGIFKDIPESSDIDYHVQRPTQREFTEVCNEFWWCSTNVAKGLAREERVYAKDMMESVVRPMFLQLLAWKIGSEHHFNVSIGKSGKFIKNYLSDEDYNKVLRTYSNANIQNTWEAFHTMTTFFQELQIELGKRLVLKVNVEETTNALQYINRIYQD
ncbi:aminoglycoside 6-adenylyltransferase [Myroides odoratimimus]|uniref:aminoglycoside 6-adenylyltransferase n=1 Tax=Myroides odoratimimus TaxID=76832 RepID=UPI0021807D1C|nr:aminoglycoside 6-adenylyltransferase [Myroides odoratimimus]MCS7473045.1 aminoglycoside 6-adenylyltransferase [Myroides odoratimimus]MDM1035697.1 aminoglycoside 6-adenylyltransferase [Myroides odoratimimus]MDM1456776.1 aminoglycoside 6-adenylyltransferase [Myroides odoratimimus]MDM1513644.1 aminoglycoside 6-adenylyltransferase [Myroides odoratimimus]MEC4086832.1 aminoglycoside 6-adenylyltransferase [Myroides odoratimimus]